MQNMKLFKLVQRHTQSQRKNETFWANFRKNIP